jgi:MFS family permease
MACGPLIGGALTEYATWRWCMSSLIFLIRREASSKIDLILTTYINAGFYINLPVGTVVGIFLLGLDIPEIKAKPPVREVLRKAVSTMDLFGLVLLWPAAIMFFLALQWGGN